MPEYGKEKRPAALPEPPHPGLVTEDRDRLYREAMELPRKPDYQTTTRTWNFALNAFLSQLNIEHPQLPAKGSSVDISVLEGRVSITLKTQELPK